MCHIFFHLNNIHSYMYKMKHLLMMMNYLDKDIWYCLCNNDSQDIADSLFHLNNIPSYMYKLKNLRLMMN